MHNRSASTGDERLARCPSDAWDNVHRREPIVADDLYGSFDRVPELQTPGVSARFGSAIVGMLRRHQLVIACFVYVLLDIFTTVYFKKLMDHTANYALVTMQVIIFFFMFLFSCLYMSARRYFPNYMSRPFNMRPLIPMALFDIAGTTLSSIGSVNTSGIVLVLLSQLSIPLTIITCKVLLGSAYHSYQYMGSFLIVLFVAMKELTVPASTGGNDLKANLIYMASCIPDSIASALRSGVYLSESFHLLKYQFSASVMQLILGFPLFTVLTAWRRTRPDLGAFSGTVYDVTSGLECLFMGRNTIVEACGDAGQLSCDNCSGTLKVLLVYLLCNMIIRVAYIVIMMNATVTLVFLLGTLKLPLCSIAFSMRSISGDSTTEFEMIDVVCFVGIIISLFMYALGRRMLEEPTLTPLAEPMLPERESSLAEPWTSDAPI